MPKFIAKSDVECVLPEKAIVGESPLWHGPSKRLYWVDIQAKKVHRFDPATKINETFKLPDLVTSLCFRKSGGLLLSLSKNFAFFDPDKHEMQLLAGVEPDQPLNRFNDGRCDPQGRFWAGTMGGGSSEKDWQAPVGNLFRFDSNLSYSLMQTKIACANGMDWAPDGRTMYQTESFRYTIFAYDFDRESGAISNRRAFAEVDKQSGGFPDGLCVDAEGGVWSNEVGLGRIVRYDPEGRIERIVELPVPRATGCTFGGDNLDILYVTSATETMTAQQIADAPLSGSIFSVRTGLKGREASYFAG